MDKMTVFLDTNVLLDQLAQREGFFADAQIIFDLVDSGIIVGIVSSVSIVNCAYVLPKHYDKNDVLSIIKKLLRMFVVTNVDGKTLEMAADMLPKDFEDAVQYISSQAQSPDCIITRDNKGFSDFDVPVLSPKEFVIACKQ